MLSEKYSDVVLIDQFRATVFKNFFNYVINKLLALAIFG